MFKKFSLILILFLLSCSKTLGPETDKNIYTRGFDTNNIEFINIYKNNNKLYIESVYRNKYTYFVGDISNVKLKDNIDQRVFANRIIKLETYKEKENNNKSFEDIKNDKNNTKINIIKYAEWSEIIFPVLENVIITLVPKKKDEAIIVSMANKDMAIFYNDINMITMEKVEYLKKNVKIVKAYSEKEFYEIVAKEIKKTPEIKSRAKNDLIIFEMKGNSETDSPYVLFDTNSNTQYYFDFSTTFKAKEGASNTDYYLQIVFNAIIKAHIIEPIKNPITTVQKGSTFVYQGIKKHLKARI